MRVFLISLFLFQAAIAEPITDPTHDYPKSHAPTMKGATRYYKLETDLNGDGRKEVIFSAGTDESGRLVTSGQIPWTIYIAKPKGRYEIARMKSPEGDRDDIAPGFSRAHYWVGYIPELKTRGILFVAEASRGRNATWGLSAIILKDGGWKEVEVAKSVARDSPEAEKMRIRTEQPSKDHITEIAYP